MIRRYTKKISAVNCQILLTLDAEIPKGYSETGPNPHVPKPVRYDNRGHYPKDFPVRKCVMCGKTAQIQCLKCQKTLHVSRGFQKFDEEESWILQSDVQIIS